MRRIPESEFQALLTEVERPLRYIGGEWNEIVKDPREVDVRFGLAYPDVYEIGMSHLGFRILYALLNAREDTAAERVFCPWPDMAEALRRRGYPLTTLENGLPLRELDILGFSLQYELTFTNVLEMLDLSGIPLRSRERGEGDPLVIAGGPVVFNIEPMAEFFDFVLIGDGELLLPEFLERYRELKRAGASRQEKIQELARIEGVYAPRLYDVEPEPELGLWIPVPRGDAPYPVRRRLLLDLDRFPFPERVLVPHGEIVHDRVSVELMRGCPVGCRFCQAGYIYRPTRERHPNDVRDTVLRSLEATGYEEFSLTSLNTGEYGAIHPLLFDLMDRLEREHVSVSLASLHASTMTPELAEQAKRVRKSGFTIAPEAGTQRLRNVINKNLTEEQILRACRLAFEAGWDLIKLYFMIGLPTETDADVDGIVDLAHKILAEGRKTDRRRRIRITLSASSFVPKAVTPFQWIGMARREEIYRKQERIAGRVRRGIRFKHHECETSFLEAVFSRGDRALAPAIEGAWRLGARFDGWSEHFRFDAWRRAFAETGVNPERYAHGEWDPGMRLPWDVVDPLINKKWLAIELRRALAEGTLSVCGPTDCHGCAPFARDCVKGIVKETTGRRLEPLRPAGRALGGAFRGAEPDGAPERRSIRYRARFAKDGRMRFLGHLDWMRTLIRALRRAGIPLRYSQGFNPRPRVAFGHALGVGMASEAEYVDFETTRRVAPDRLREALAQELPRGLRLLALTEIGAGASLMESVRAARYRVELAGAEELERVLARWAGREPLEVVRERKGRVQTFDLREEVLALEAHRPRQLQVVLALHADGASVRPDEALSVLVGRRVNPLAVVREELLVPWQGKWVNPLLAASAVAGAARAVAAG